MAHDSLFDLAVNRALLYALRLGLLADPQTLQGRLEPWYLRTRFAYRIPLEEVVTILLTYPGDSRHWRGGREGAWHEGHNPRP